MPKKTKADLEKELREARKHLKDIVDCFVYDEEGVSYNKLAMDKDTIESLDEALDEAREFLK